MPNVVALATRNISLPMDIREPPVPIAWELRSDGQAVPLSQRIDVVAAGFIPSRPGVDCDGFVTLNLRKNLTRVANFFVAASIDVRLRRRIEQRANN